MAYLRCEGCGAKALPIATRCPACEHPFDDEARGRNAPRRRTCSGCESLIARDAPECRWCGSEVGRGFPGWGGIASAAAVLMVVLGAGWFASSRDSDVILLVGPSQESVERVAPPTSSARAASPAVSPSGEPSAPATGSPANDEPATAAVARAELGERPEPSDVAPSEVGERAEFSTPTHAIPTDDVAWVQAIARTFVNIRSAPAPDGAVQGVVPENDVVLLGTARGAWREVRSGDLTGWAWEPLFSMSSEGP